MFYLEAIEQVFLVSGNLC